MKIEKNLDTVLERIHISLEREHLNGIWIAYQGKWPIYVLLTLRFCNKIIYFRKSKQTVEMSLGITIGFNTITVVIMLLPQNLHCSVELSLKFKLIQIDLKRQKIQMIAS